MERGREVDAVCSLALWYLGGEYSAINIASFHFGFSRGGL